MTSESGDHRSRRPGFPASSGTRSLVTATALLLALLFDPATGTVPVPAFTDMKVHDITTGPDDPNCESLNMHAQPGTAAFHGGNCRFITRKLWGVANEPPYFHHGKFTTMREAIEAHRGEAVDNYEAWAALDGS